jgi:major intracellular serine protease
MVKFIQFVLIALLANNVYAKEPIRVAIVDTGLDLTDTRFTKHLCKEGHKDYTDEGIQDKNGHGTHVAGIIAKFAMDANFCLVIIKYYSETVRIDRWTAYLASLKHAVDLKVNYINLSSNGDGDSKFERELIKNNPDIKFVVAAGNENKNLDVDVTYPASYDYKNVIVVGSTDKANKKLPSSNYGKIVDHWALGKDVFSTLPNNKLGYMSGTSQATATITGWLVKKQYDVSN